MGYRVWGLEFKLRGLGFRVNALGLRSSFGFRLPSRRRWLKLPFDPLSIHLPMYGRAPKHKDRKVVPEAASVVLPSDVLDHLAGRGLLAECLEGYSTLQDWWDVEVDETYLSLVGKDASRYPIVCHEDGVPFSHNETGTFWSWSCPLSSRGSDISRFPIAAVVSSRIAHATREEIAKIISWDLRSLAEGRWPSLDYNGEPFLDGSRRATRAGKPMRLKAVFAYWKGDQEAHKLSHRLKRHYGCNLVCDWCWASAVDQPLSFANFQDGALWRMTTDHVHLREDDRSPWQSVQGYTKRRRLYDSCCKKTSNVFLFLTSFVRSFCDNQPKSQTGLGLIYPTFINMLLDQVLHLVHLGFMKDLIGAVLMETLHNGVWMLFHHTTGFDVHLYLEALLRDNESFFPCPL